MLHFKRMFAALTFLAAGLAGMSIAAPPAGAVLVDPAYCPVTGLSGHVDYDSVVTLTPAANTFVMTVSCTAPGLSHNAGSYSLTLTGTTPLDTCAGAALTGSGTITGSGPHGATTGTFTFIRPGIHYYIDGAYSAGGAGHTLKLWLDIVNPSPSPCSYDQADIIGHGAFGDDVVLGTGPASGVVNGSGTISPGLTVTGITYFLSFSGTVVGDFNGVPGTCNVSFSGSGSGSLALSSGSGTGSCHGADILATPIAIWCDIDFTIAGSVTATGLCGGSTAGTFAGTFVFQSTSAPGAPVTSFTASGPFSIA